VDSLDELAEMILSGKIKNKDELNREKVKVARKYRLDQIPSNTEIMHRIPEERREEFNHIIRIKPMRSLSGVAVVAIMTSPYACPHGKCIYCPGGPDNGTAQSYTGHEPAAMRAEQNHFDPYLQTTNRIAQLEEIGHPTDKIDLIIMGGTFTARPYDYQREFVKGAFDGMDGIISKSLEEAQELNERASHRCIGLTVETRPDWFMENEIENSLRLGATRVELGIQSTFDDVLEFVKRGHTVADSIRSTRLTKDAGMKIVYHMMPGLPGSSIQKDMKSFRRIFTDPDFMPDMLKIYPTLVVKGTELYDMWKKGEYEPLDTDAATELLIRVKEIVPPWVRIQRIQRDIPTQYIEAGVKRSDLRGYIQARMKEQGKKCSCIRCREIGHTNSKIGPKDVSLVRGDYEASHGKEVFLSYEGPNAELIGFVRLRKIPEDSWKPETGEYGAIIRELKVFGSQVPIGDEPKGRWQHQGYGRKLVDEAEIIAKEGWGTDGILVMSGVGVREYYKKLGYERVSTYMGKRF